MRPTYHRPKGAVMWAQLITVRLREEGDDPVTRILAQLREIEQPDSGWVRTFALRDQADPSRVLVLAMFESEERARARESDPRRAEGVAELQALAARHYAGPPEFTDLDVIGEVAP